MTEGWRIASDLQFLGVLASDNTLVFIAQILSLLLSFGSFVLALKSTGRSATRRYALISIVCFLAFASFILYEYRRIELDHKDHYRFSSFVYGVTRDDLHRIAYILPSGKVKQSLTMTFRAVRQEVEEVEQTYLVPASPKGTEESLEGSELTKLKLPCKEGGRNLVVDHSAKDGRKVIHKMKFSPRLPRGESCALASEMKWESTPFAMTAAEMRGAGYSPEYSAMRITYPGNAVTLEVHFPRLYTPEKLVYSVYNGPGDVVNMTEVGRLQGLSTSPLSIVKQNQETVARLHVEYPILGLTYAITWIPPEEWNPDSALAEDEVEDALATGTISRLSR